MIDDHLRRFFFIWWAADGSVWALSKLDTLLYVFLYLAQGMVILFLYFVYCWIKVTLLYQPFGFFDLTCTFFVSFFHQDWDIFMYLFYLIHIRANKYSPECIKHMSWQLRWNIWHLYTSDGWHIQRNQWPLLSIFLTPSFSVIKWKLYIKCNFFLTF